MGDIRYFRDVWQGVYNFWLFIILFFLSFIVLGYYNGKKNFIISSLVVIFFCVLFLIIILVYLFRKVSVTKNGFVSIPGTVPKYSELLNRNIYTPIEFISTIKSGKRFKRIIGYEKDYNYYFYFNVLNIKSIKEIDKIDNKLLNPDIQSTLKYDSSIIETIHVKGKRNIICISFISPLEPYFDRETSLDINKLPKVKMIYLTLNNPREFINYIECLKKSLSNL